MGSNYSHLKPENNDNVENIPDTKKIYNVNDYKPSNIPWLEEIIPVHKCKNSKEKGIFTSIAIQPYNEKLWDIFQNSLPPYHALKYHSVNLEAYINEFNDKHFISQASILLFWNQNFGIRLLNTIHESILIDKNNYDRKFDDMKDWFCQANGTLAMIRKTQYSNYKVPPTENDLCKSSKEFLLDSNILIQLPFKLTLLHQWLVLALYEILVFEKDTVEFRHLPIDESMVPLVGSILSLVCKLKERVMLGFAILNSITVNYTMSRSWNPSQILDHVILPSIPALEYLFNENPGKMLQNNIKSGTGKNYYVPVASYKLDSDLSSLHTKFAYNIQAWCTDKEIKSLFPQTNIKITNIVSRINSSNDSKIPTEKARFVKSFSDDEKVLLEFVKKKVKLNQKEKIQATIKVIRTEIIDKNKIPGLKLSQVESKFQNAESKASEIFNENKNDNIHNAIRCALMFNNAYKMLVNHEKSQSIASKIISLQIYILEQEQIARLSNVCSIMFNIKPENLDQKQNIVDIKNVEIEKVLLKMNNANRDSFWSLFPKEWKAPIQQNEYAIIETPNTDVELTSILTQFNTRIGSLIYSITRHCLRKNVLYEDVVNDLNIIHYILPCIVYSFAYEFKIEKEVSLYLNWIKEMIEQYENSYLSGLNEQTKKTGKEGFSLEFILESIASNDSMNYCFNRNMSFVSKLSENEGFLDKMMHINSCFLEWTNDLMNPSDSVEDLKTFNEFLCFLQKHQTANHLFLNAMYDSSQEAFDIPLYVMCFEDKNVELVEMYFATIILLELSLMYSSTMNHPGNSSIKHPLISELTFIKANDALKNTDTSIFSHAMFTDSAFKKENYKFDFDYKKHAKVLYDFYQIIKKYWNSNHGPPEQDKYLSLHSFVMDYDDIVEEGIRLFLEGDFDQFEEHIKVFKHVHILDKVGIRNCDRCNADDLYDLFIPCDICIQEECNDAHYYCSKKCKNAMWNDSHEEYHFPKVGIRTCKNCNADDVYDIFLPCGECVEL